MVRQPKPTLPKADPIPTWVWETRGLICKGHKAQKFHRGDIVLVDNTKLPNRSHFTNGIGVIVGSYADQYGVMLSEEDRDDDDDAGNPLYSEYTVDFGPSRGKSSWHPAEAIALLYRE